MYETEEDSLLKVKSRLAEIDVRSMDYSFGIWNTVFSFRNMDSDVPDMEKYGDDSL